MKFCENSCVTHFRVSISYRRVPFDVCWVLSLVVEVKLGVAPGYRIGLCLVFERIVA